MWWLRCFPNLEGVASDFKLILGLLQAVRISLLLARGLSFFLVPLLSLLLNIISEVRDYRVRNKVIVVRGTLVLRQISVGLRPL